MRLRIAAHRSSRSVIWALRKAMPTLEAVSFEYKLASNVLRARSFVGIKWDICKFRSLAGAEGIGPKAFGVIDAAHFFINFPTLLFRKDQHNRTLVPYAFLAVFLGEMARSAVEICCCRYAFFGSGASLHNALSSGRCARRQIRSIPATNSGMLIGLMRNGCP